LFAALAAALPSLAKAQVLTRSGSLPFAAPNSVVVADFNHDGAMDFAVASYDIGYGGPGVAVFLGNGDGTFKQPITYGVTNGAGPLAIGDLNHDGNPDLVASSYGSNAVVVLLGNSDGTFQPPVTYETSGYPEAIILGNFNNDGQLDIAVAGYTTVSVIDILLAARGRTTEKSRAVTSCVAGA
jgi:hypothetical protein